MFLFLLHASLSLLSHQACAWSTLVGLQSFLTLCHRSSQAHRHHSHITPGPLPLRSLCLRPPAVVAVVVTSPPALTTSSSRCSQPPAIVAIVGVTINLTQRRCPSHHPRSTAVALTLVVNGPPPLLPLQSHLPCSNQHRRRLT
jgi:hypothetical protein